MGQDSRYGKLSQGSFYGLSRFQGAFLIIVDIQHIIGVFGQKRQISVRQILRFLHPVQLLQIIGNQHNGPAFPANHCRYIIGKFSRVNPFHSAYSGNFPGEAAVNGRALVRACNRQIRRVGLQRFDGMAHKVCGDGKRQKEDDA